MNLEAQRYVNKEEKLLSELAKIVNPRLNPVENRDYKMTEQAGENSKPFSGIRNKKSRQ